jgi:hypothetical protein
LYPDDIRGARTTWTDPPAAKWQGSLLLQRHRAIR